MKNFLIKNKLWVIIVTIALIISIAYYYIFIHNAQTTEDKSGATDKSPSVNKKSFPNPNATLQFPVRAGDVGKQVKQLQKYLNVKYNAGLQTDAVWGEKTQTAFEKASIPTDDPSRFYIVLTESLYNKLNLKSY